MLKSRLLTLLILLPIFFVLVWLLLSGSEILLLPVGGNGTSLVWGNVIAWAIFFLLPLLFLIGFGKLRSKYTTDSRLKFIFLLFYISLGLGTSWGFVSRLLSGNWLFNFVNAPYRSLSWYYYSMATVSLPLIAGLWLLVWSFWPKRVEFGK